MQSMEKLCLGTVQFGMLYGVNNALGRQPDRRECYGIIEEALQAGIRYFDTASAYGTAESLLGDFSWGRYEPKIISKIPPDCADDADEIAARLQASLRRLQTRRLYGYLLHRGADMNRPSVMAGLMAAKAQGLAEKIGVSVYEPAEALQAAMDTRIDIIQIPYNVLDRRLDRVGFFAKAHENRKEVYARSAFLQGLLLMQPAEAEARVPKSGKWIAAFQETAREYGYTPAEAGMLYSLSHTGIDHVVFGVETVEQVRTNLAIQQKIDGFGNCYKALAGMFREDVPREILVPSLWR